MLEGTFKWKPHKYTVEEFEDNVGHISAQSFISWFVIGLTRE